jgi:glycosyltransferase involved in cell wall biosynthesis
MSRRVRRTARGPLKVALVCGQLEVGGQESGIASLLARFDRARIAPRLYAFRGGALAPAMRRIGVPLTIGSRRAANPDVWTDLDRREKAQFRRHLAAALRDDRIDVCLVFGYGDAVQAAREAGVRAIVERVDGPKLAGFVQDKSSCQQIICESDAIARLVRAQREWLRARGVPVAVIRNGVDVQHFDPSRFDRAAIRRRLGVAADDFVIGSIARLAPVKNLGHILEATRLAIDRVGSSTRIRVLIAGPDEGSEAGLRQQARELGLTRHVQFLGPSDAGSVLSALDVFVLPSFQEGVPFGVLEAMAMRLPVIATQSDSIAEIVEDSAFLVGPLDPMRTMAAVKALIRHAGLRRALGDRGRRIAARHDASAMARQYERALHKAFRASAALPAFRRRVVIVPGHPRGRRVAGRHVMDTLFAALKQEKVDVHELTLRESLPNELATWPPRRRQAFPATRPGRRARRVCLEWLKPDVIVTDCPKVVQLARGTLPGETIVFCPRSTEPCDAPSNLRRLVDHIVFDKDPRSLLNLLTAP